MGRRGQLAVVLASVLALAVPAVPASATVVEDGVVHAKWASDPQSAVGVTAAVRDVSGDVRDVIIAVETADGSFGVAEGGPTTTVTVQADVLFAFDKADLTAAARAKLADVASELRTRRASGSVTVGGHADTRGDDRYNQVLSERRARAVAAALQPLVRDLQVSLIPQGFGDTRPVAANTKADGSDNPAGRARNRRVTVTFTPPATGP
jgi:outer membrane protein OmpA-like peptidoglycan-associated protein